METVSFGSSFLEPFEMVGDSAYVLGYPLIEQYTLLCADLWVSFINDSVLHSNILVVVERKIIPEKYVSAI